MNCPHIPVPCLLNNPIEYMSCLQNISLSPFPPFNSHDIHAFQLLRRDLSIDNCRYPTVHMEMQCGASIHSPTIAQLSAWCHTYKLEVPNVLCFNSQIFSKAIILQHTLGSTAKTPVIIEPLIEFSNPTHIGE